MGLLRQGGRQRGAPKNESAPPVLKYCLKGASLLRILLSISETIKQERIMSGHKVCT